MVLYLMQEPQLPVDSRDTLLGMQVPGPAHAQHAASLHSHSLFIGCLSSSSIQLAILGCVSRLRLIFWPNQLVLAWNQLPQSTSSGPHEITAAKAVLEISYQKGKVSIAFLLQ